VALLSLAVAGLLAVLALGYWALATSKRSPSVASAKNGEPASEDVPQTGAGAQQAQAPRPKPSDQEAPTPKGRLGEARQIAWRTLKIPRPARGWPDGARITVSLLKHKYVGKVPHEELGLSQAGRKELPEVIALSKAMASGFGADVGFTNPWGAFTIDGSRRPSGALGVVVFRFRHHEAPGGTGEYLGCVAEFHGLDAWCNKEGDAILCVPRDCFTAPSEARLVVCDREGEAIASHTVDLMDGIPIPDDLPQQTAVLQDRKGNAHHLQCIGRPHDSGGDVQWRMHVCTGSLEKPQRIEFRDIRSIQFEPHVPSARIVRSGGMWPLDSGRKATVELRDGRIVAVSGAQNFHLCGGDWVGRTREGRYVEVFVTDIQSIVFGQ